VYTWFGLLVRPITVASYQVSLESLKDMLSMSKSGPHDYDKCAACLHLLMSTEDKEIRGCKEHLSIQPVPVCLSPPLTYDSCSEYVLICSLIVKIKFY